MSYLKQPGEYTRKTTQRSKRKYTIEHLAWVPHRTDIPQNWPPLDSLFLRRPEGARVSINTARGQLNWTPLHTVFTGLCIEVEICQPDIKHLIVIGQVGYLFPIR